MKISNFILEQINAYQPPHEQLPWSVLAREAKGLVHRIEKEWAQLVHRHGGDERALTKFISQYPAFLLPVLSDTYFVLSEIRLGADYVIDFIIPQDGASDGMKYTLIEVEPASKPPFKHNGDKSAALSHAIDQVENWKRWIRRNRGLARQLFPCAINKHEVRLDYQIIIGTRENSRKWLDKRNEVSQEYRIDIRSHDMLGDNIRRSAVLMPDFSRLCSAEEDSLSAALRNALANPFYTTFGDKVWRSLEQELRPTDHFHVYNADILINARRYNEDFADFEAFCRKRKLVLERSQDRYLIKRSGVRASILG